MAEADGVGCKCGWPLDPCNAQFSDGRCGKAEHGAIEHLRRTEAERTRLLHGYAATFTGNDVPPETVEAVRQIARAAYKQMASEGDTVPPTFRQTIGIEFDKKGEEVRLGIRDPENPDQPLKLAPGEKAVLEIELNVVSKSDA